MLPKSTARTLTAAKLTSGDFTATKLNSPEDKAAFGNKLLTFIADDCPRTTFTKAFYQKLMNTFGHIAHYNIDGFYDVFFQGDRTKLEFLEQTLEFPCWGGPAYTFSDVERAVQARIRASDVVDVLKVRLADSTREAELRQFATLQAKFGASSPAKAAPEPAPAIAPVVPSVPRGAQPHKAQLANQLDLFSAA